eukprot:7652948-Pyramimonas_sp.AAC.1
MRRQSRDDGRQQKESGAGRGGKARHTLRAVRTVPERARPTQALFPQSAPDALDARGKNVQPCPASRLVRH